MTNLKRIEKLERHLRRLKTGIVLVVGIAALSVSFGAAKRDRPGDLDTSNIKFVDPESGKTIASLGVSKRGDIELTSEDGEQKICFSLRGGKSTVQVVNGDLLAQLLADTDKTGFHATAGAGKPQVVALAIEKDPSDLSGTEIALYGGNTKSPRVLIKTHEPNGPNPTAFIEMCDRYGDDKELLLFKK